MKTTSKIILILLLIQVSLVAFSSDDVSKDTLNLPKRALIISQSSNISGIFYTMIDLNNNEMVIVYYGTDLDYSDIRYFKLRKVIRTGIILDPAEQKKLKNTYQVKERMNK